MEPSAPEPITESARPSGKAIEIDRVTIKNLDDAERLVAAIQRAARVAFGRREGALGTPSMPMMALWGVLHQVETHAREPGSHRVTASMGGILDVYRDDELMGFVELREGGGYVRL